MNENLEDVVLDDIEDTQSQSVEVAEEATDAVEDAVEDVVEDASADEPTTVDATPASESDGEAAEAPVVKIRKKPGRKLDTTGVTALGKARLLYAANPSMSTKELKALFIDRLQVSKQVAQTYVSYVRKPAKAAA